MTELKTNKDILEELNSLNKTVDVSNEEEQTTEYKKGWEVGFSAAKHMFYQKSRQSAIEWINLIEKEMKETINSCGDYDENTGWDKGQIYFIKRFFNITEEDLREERETNGN